MEYDKTTTGQSLIIAEQALVIAGQKLVSIALGLWSNPMVCKWLVQPLSSIARSLSETPMEWKILFWHIFPSPRSLCQWRWNEKSFCSEVHPSPKDVFQPRWLNRSSGFHRPGNFLSVDGTKGRFEVLESNVFHPGRNYLSLDGVWSHKWPVIFPSAQKFLNSRCIGQQKVPKWSPSQPKFPW